MREPLKDKNRLNSQSVEHFVSKMIMKKLILLLSLMLSFAVSAMAAEVEIGGLWYEIVSKTKEAKVIPYKSKPYSDIIVIPQTVEYEGTNYSVTSIGDRAFGNCRAMTSVTIPNSVTSIGDWAFGNCSSMTSIIIPNSVTSIGEYVFSECYSLTSVMIGNGVKSIGIDAFQNCSPFSLYISDLNAWCNIVFKNRDSNPFNRAKQLFLNNEEIKDLVIPNSVTSIGDYAFYKCRFLNSVTIPNSVTRIGDSSFESCLLTSLTIGNGLSSMGSYAFAGCSELTSVTIGNGVTSIGDGAFIGCSSLTSITIPNSVTSIGDDAFRQCSSLSSVTIPNSVTSIGDGAFRQCSGLTSVTIGNGVSSIGNNTFAACSELTSLTIPNSVTSIGDYAFYYCSSLTSVTIGNGVKKIGDGAFSGCSGLTSVTIPNSVTSIGGSSFSGCSGLTSVTIPNGVKKIEDSSFRGCSGLTSVTIPNSVTIIERWSFSECSGLTSVTIPNSVTSIGYYAFYGCSGLTTIIIGNGIKTIYAGAFAKCLELTDVFCYAENVPSMIDGNNIPTDAFEGSYIEYATLHVPTTSINTYKSIAPWSDFKTIIGLDGTMSDDPEEQDAPKCATPTINYFNGKLKFDCETEGVEFISEITDKDVKKFYTSEVDLTATYTISVYAVKSGYDNSDVATATLCWIDVDPKTEGISNGVANVRANPVLIQSSGNVVSISGAPNGEEISIYNLSGQKVGSAKVQSETTDVFTSLQTGEVGIVKIGSKSVKVVVR